jgi:hypothetical protein
MPQAFTIVARPEARRRLPVMASSDSAALGNRHPL